MTDNLFETLAYDEFDTPFDSIDDIAHFILNPDNTGLVFKALRLEIAANAERPRAAQTGHRWSMMTVGVLRGLPEARVFFTSPIAYDQIRAAVMILDRAAELMKGTL